MVSKYLINDFAKMLILFTIKNKDKLIANEHACILHSLLKGGGGRSGER